MNPPLYHLTILPPKMPHAEALSQEISALQSHFGGDLNYLNPNRFSPLPIPRLLFGFHQLARLRQQEASIGVHHIFNPDPFPFPVLRFFRRPVIYSITGGIAYRLNAAFFNRLAATVVPDERSLAQLESAGVKNAVLVRPGIRTEKFSVSPTPLIDTVHLLAASAPWTKAQFTTKGIDALLTAAAREPKLRLTFLWRGILFDEMMRRVKNLGVENRVTVINKLVDVNAVLATVHATITLATDAGIVKSYPHSLLDSLAAGKPVLVSRAIPMADFVEKTGCGAVIDAVSADGVLAGVASLAKNYSPMVDAVRIIPRETFSISAMVAAYRTLYEQVSV